MQIERITKGSWGKIRAFVDFNLEGVVVKGFKLIDGSNGLFLGMPSQKNKDGEYNDTVFMEPQMKMDAQNLALSAYGTSAEPQAAPANDFQGPPPFTDDDIPF
jgi:DNA-binding cell septation regulator SpoVG